MMRVDGALRTGQRVRNRARVIFSVLYILRTANVAVDQVARTITSMYHRSLLSS